MGCGMSRSNLMDDFGSRSPFHHKLNTAPPKLLMNDSSKSSIVRQPPVLQKISTTREANYHKDGRSRMISGSNGDPMWFGSPSFREYVQCGLDVKTTGDEQGVEAIVGTHGGEKLTCNRQVCELGDSKEKALADRKDAKGGRFRKAFQVHRVTFWHGDPWHAGQSKVTRRAI